MRVAIFTDNDFDKTNGVTTTLRAVLRHAPPDVRPRVYTMSDLACDADGYLAVASIGVPIPWYREMRMYVPRTRVLRRHLRQDAIPLVHITTPGPVGLAGKYLAARMHLPTIGSFHTHLAEYTTILSGSDRLGGLMDRYMRWVYGGCERLLVPSEDTRSQLRNRGWGADCMSIWPRGVDTMAFTPARRSESLRSAWHVSDRCPALLYAGRVSAEKGLALLHPIRSLLHRHGVPFRLVVAGDGPMLHELRAACPEAEFLGRVPHERMGAVMASADVLVFPSDTDSAGNVVLEAQACGLPVVVSRKGGPREQIVPGATGFACRPGDMLDFTDRTMELLTKPGRRIAMGAAARTYALGRTWQIALEPLYAAYRAVLASRPQPSTAPVDPSRVPA